MDLRVFRWFWLEAAIALNSILCSGERHDSAANFDGFEFEPCLETVWNTHGLRQEAGQRRVVRSRSTEMRLNAERVLASSRALKRLKSDLLIYPFKFKDSPLNEREILGDSKPRESHHSFVGHSIPRLKKRQRIRHSFALILAPSPRYVSNKFSQP